MSPFKSMFWNWFIWQTEAVADYMETRVGFEFYETPELTYSQPFFRETNAKRCNYSTKIKRGKKRR